MSWDLFHDEMAPHRPKSVELGEGASSVVRNHANQQHRSELVHFFATSAGRKLIGRVDGPLSQEVETAFNTLDPDSPDWPRMFCAECYAGAYPDFEPVRGLDSHRECAEDGEPVFWSVPLTPTEVWAHRVLNVLVDTCAAGEHLRREFVFHFPECREFRFQGALGFGGKVYSTPDKPAYVGCYKEDRNPERDAMVMTANARLASLGPGWSL